MVPTSSIASFGISRIFYAHISSGRNYGYNRISGPKRKYKHWTRTQKLQLIVKTLNLFL